MLKILNPTELKDFLRSYNPRLDYGLPIARPYHSLGWRGAYSKELPIGYFIARKINEAGIVIENYEISTDLIIYENGQYLYDLTKVYNGYLPEGVYFHEFNNGQNTFYSQAFAVVDYSEIELASGAILASSNNLINETNIKDANILILKQFTDSRYVEFAY